MDEIIERDLFLAIKPYIPDQEIIVIHGSRQVGKTSLLLFLKKKIEKNISRYTCYLDLEDSGFLKILNRGVEETIRWLEAKGLKLHQRLYLFIDEIQYLDDPSSFLKLLHDRYKGMIKLIITGSSTFSIKSKFRHSLVGRVVDFELFPLSFSEFLRFKKLHYDLSLERIPAAIHEELRGFFREYVVKGGYPALALEKVTEKQEKKLKQIISTYIRSDIRDIGRIRNLQKFNHLLDILAGQAGNLLNISELSVTLGISMQTVEEYLFILENTYVIKRITPYFKNIRSELTKMPKIFFEDTGVANIIDNHSFTQKLSGGLFENSVFSEIRKISGTEFLNYWRTTKGHEVDFIISEKEIIPIEVKVSLRTSDFSSLRYFLDKYSLKKGYVCTFGEKTQAPDKRIGIIHPWDLAGILR